MDDDISFAIAILREDYKKRRAVLISGELELRRIDNVLCELETIQKAINKIERVFE